LLIHIENFNKTNTLKLLSFDYSKGMRSLNITMSNPYLLEGQWLFKAIYNTLITNDEFLDLVFKKL